MSKRVKSQIGNVYGKLIVTRRGEDIVAPSGRKYIAWYCDCECGKKDILVKANSLFSGNTKSCGCLQKEIATIVGKTYGRKYNKYQLSGEYGIGWTSNTNEEFYFDLEDYEKIKDCCWFESDQGYIMTNIDCRLIRLHRYILNITDDNYVVDHINHRPKDNRKVNLRICEKADNCRNNLPKKQGIYYRDDMGKYMAYIGFNNENIYLGLYSNYEDAFQARKKAEEKYFGEFSYDNSMKQAEEYKIEGE